MSKKQVSIDSIMKEYLTEYLENEFKEIKVMLNNLVNSKKNYPEYMELGVACEYLSISRNTLNKYISSYDLPIIKIDGVRRISKKELDIFMSHHKC